MAHKQSSKGYHQRHVGWTRDQIISELKRETKKLEKELIEIKKARQTAIKIRQSLNEPLMDLITAVRSKGR